MILDKSMNEITDNEIVDHSLAETHPAIYNAIMYVRAQQFIGAIHEASSINDVPLNELVREATFDLHIYDRIAVVGGTTRDVAERLDDFLREVGLNIQTHGDAEKIIKAGRALGFKA